MSSSVDVAVVGATGLVGSTIIEILEARDFPVKQLYPVASSRSVGETVSFRGRPLAIHDLANFNFTKTQIALFSPGAHVSERYAPIAAKAGCVVIDNTSQFRYDRDIPLVVPEVNPQEIARFRERNMIANPNCSTIQLVVALKPIYDAVGIARINVATYQSVSGSGQAGIHELVKQTQELMNGCSVEAKHFSKQIGFNAIPHIDVFQENGYSKEEMKMVWETRKILGDDTILVNPTCVRIPVFYGHAEAVHIETREFISVAQVRELLSQAPGVLLVDDVDAMAFPTPIEHGSGQDEVAVGRVRQDISHPNGINLWIVADNIRKGAALNAVQIAEIVWKEYL